MTITHHLDDATLMSYAAGSLPDTLAAVAAAHVGLCNRCRDEVAMHERVGAALFSQLAPEPIARQPQDIDMEKLQRARMLETAGAGASPLERMIGGPLDSVRWRWIGPGLWHRPLACAGGGALQLIKAAPGASVPDHTHGGSELTLVLTGALVDETGTYNPGDVADLDESVQHTPVADGVAGCICLIANEQPTQFRGLLARLMQRWHGL
jgi:putative transcriptional regulator